MVKDLKYYNKLGKIVQKFDKAIEDEDLGNVIKSFLKIEKLVQKESGFTKREKKSMGYSKSIYEFFTRKEGQKLVIIEFKGVTEYFNILTSFYKNLLKKGLSKNNEKVVKDYVKKFS